MLPSVQALQAIPLDMTYAVYSIIYNIRFESKYIRILKVQMPTRVRSRHPELGWFRTTTDGSTLARLDSGPLAAYTIGAVWRPFRVFCLVPF